jgi:hypothetical protein
VEVASGHDMPVYDHARTRVRACGSRQPKNPRLGSGQLRDIVAIPQTFQQVAAGGAVSAPESGADGGTGQAAGEKFFQDNIMRFRRFSGAILTAMATCLVVCLVYQAISSPAKDDPFRVGCGFSEVWWSANLYSLFLVWSAITFSAVYMVARILWRRIVIDTPHG